MKSTAVLLFARSVGNEANTKGVFKLSEHTYRFWEGLNQRVLATIQSTKLDYFHIDQLGQKGQAFGERISYAIHDVFEQGYQRVIVLGNDCPDINATDINQAAEELTKTPLVLGPDQRGGSYLIGIDRSVFDQGKFKNLPWQTNRIFSSLARLVDQVEILESKHDINSRHELHVLVRVIDSIKLLIKRILTIVIPELPVFHKKSHVLAFAIQRGPPTEN